MESMFSVACCVVAVAGLAAAATAAPFSPAAPAYNNAVSLPLPPPEPLGPRTFANQRSLVYATSENTSQVDGFQQAAPHRLVTGLYGFNFPSSVAWWTLIATSTWRMKFWVCSRSSGRGRSRRCTPPTISGEAIDLEIGPDNNAYISEFNGPGVPGTIQVFKPRAQQPFETFSTAEIPLMYYIGFDAQGNLYVDGLARPGQSDPFPTVGASSRRGPRSSKYCR